MLHVSKDSLSCDTRSLDCCFLFKIFIFISLILTSPYFYTFSHTFYLTPFFYICGSMGNAFLSLLMGDSRKYSYHTTGSILEFRGRGGVSWTGILKTWGGNAVWNSKGMGGCFSSEFSEFPEERRRKLRLKSLTC